MKYFLPVLSLGLFLTACGDVKNPNGMPDQPTSQEPVKIISADPAKPDPQAAKTENPVMPADTSVAGAWLLLDGALRSHDAQVLNQLMDPEYGLWVLEQAGGKPLVTRVADVDAFRDQRQQPIFALDKKLMTCAAPTSLPKLPVAACPAGKFPESGCFHGPATAFRALGFWPGATVKGGTRQQGEAAQGRIVRSVLQTNTGYQFHFSKSAGSGGRWRLVFIDLRGACGV
ncbi:hypothetical protein SAMN06265337_0158 [Hymenobacter gelipurpurascens]|uniref:Uncharacterized protein n=1 Tax=Hymenobacter gelipurpurascens TaxID=89968 RepID=A0A212T1Q7_9BACT|nr:hypothetical protein [Hymenobacter gelipurpurascens]SNC59945.1 hypothetical protein SAMN06265337_0158 [Hymenobacter gelipurpurascens]